MQQPENARSRALLKGMGYTTAELKKPRIGIANSWGETSPGHFHLRGVGDAVKAGVWQAGGTPFEFNSFAQCPMDIGKHGIRYDTATRDIVAAEIEAATFLHMFDGLVMISSCDKNVPANLLAACRLDIPVIIVTGGPMLAGRQRGEDTDTTTLDAACWAYGVGETPISMDEMDRLEDSVCPGPGACALLGTAKYHAVSRGSHGFVAARCRHHPGSRCQKAASGKGDGTANYDAGGKRNYVSSGYYKAEFVQCDSGTSCHRRFDQCNHSSFGHGV